MPILEILIEKQAALKLVDWDFAQEIGISQPLWSLVKREKARITPDTLQKVLRRWPELAPYVLLEMMGEGEKVDE